MRMSETREADSDSANIAMDLNDLSTMLFR